MLNGSRAITTVTLGPFTYALVTAFVSNGVQIINITDPASPSPVTSITYDNRPKLVYGSDDSPSSPRILHVPSQIMYMQQEKVL